jgi:putative flippase GtrA
VIDAATRRQIVRFAVSGVLATASDAAVYFALAHTLLDGRLDLAKATSFVVGTVVAWVLASTWTFAGAERGARRAGAFFALYAAASLVNVGGNRVALTGLFAVGAGRDVAEPVAFVLATAASTVLNFVGQRRVFRRAR